MTQYEFEEEDLKSKIIATNKKDNLLENSYVSLSGGKDSIVAHIAVDLALPNNKIPRVFINTGIEYNDIVKFVKELARKDDRIIIINSKVNIPKMLKEFGYPFKSKEHSQKVALFQRSGITKTINDYLTKETFNCPKKLRYNFDKNFTLNCSDMCCYKLKKEVIAKWQKENNKTITITGMRKEEGGNRTTINCIVTDSKGKLKKFHPLAIRGNDFIEEFIKQHNIELCKLYYPPFNFKRTGCKGCPFNIELQSTLDLMEKHLPNEKKQCEMIWKPVYEEYRRINYRLKKTKIKELF